MALVLLPVESIAPTYKMLPSEPVQKLTVCEKQKQEKLKTYYNNYWLKQVGIQLCLFWVFVAKQITISKYIKGRSKISFSHITPTFIDIWML